MQYAFLTPLYHGIFRFVTLPLEIPEKTSFYPWKFCKIVWCPLEIPNKFFFNTPGNCLSFLLDYWNIYMLFLQYLWKIYVFNHVLNALSILQVCWKYTTKVYLKYNLYTLNVLQLYFNLLN